MQLQIRITKNKAIARKNCSLFAIVAPQQLLRSRQFLLRNCFIFSNSDYDNCINCRDFFTELAKFSNCVVTCLKNRNCGFQLRIKLSQKLQYNPYNCNKISNLIF